MAGMFYTLIEVAEKLGKTENQVKEMVSQGKLREFRDGAKLLFKKDEVDALAGDESAVADDTFALEDEGLVEGSTFGLLEDSESLESAKSSQMDIESDIDSELDASGLDLGLGGSDIDIDLAASRAGDDLDLNVVNDEKSESQPEEPETSAEDSQEELTLAPMDEDIEISEPEPESKTPELPAEEELMELAPAESELGGADTDFLGLDDTASSQDTKAAVEGVSILGDTDKGYELTEDTIGETAEIKLQNDELGAEPSLEDDVNLESFGSGSGLLDLSLQADDTSLGAVLDDIIPGAGASDEPVAAGDLDLAAEADTVLVEPESAEPVSGAGAFAATSAVGSAGVGVAAIGYIEPPADTASNAFGISLIIPLIALVYVTITAISASVGVVPSMANFMQGLMPWYVVGGMLAIALIIVAVGAMSGTAKKPKTVKPKAVKPKAVKKKK